MDFSDLKQGADVEVLFTNSDKYIPAKINIENNYYYLCQNYIQGALCEDRLGFKLSWCIGNSGDEDFERSCKSNFIQNIRLLNKNEDFIRDIDSTTNDLIKLGVARI